MAQPFVIDGVCHSYNFSEENLPEVSGTSSTAFSLFISC